MTAQTPAGGWNFQTSYLDLPSDLYQRVEPSPVADPRLLVLNSPLCRELGLDEDYLRSRAGVAELAGNRLPGGSTPLAQAYAGHQFGHFTMLGDGRAILMGEHIDPGGTRRDIQWKGSGRTRFSRGDGRAAVGPMLREYLVSEAMHAMGIPTTRSLAVVATGEVVQRDAPLPGAVLVRVATSHIRVGTFEFAAAFGDTGTLQSLLDYTLARHGISAADNPARALLEAMIHRQASLIAHWMGVGFVHGVMNTDNMALSGETIDYGPCAFLDRYRSDTVFSSIDRNGRYAYGNQPAVAAWNLARLAEALLPVWPGIDPVAEAGWCLEQFEPAFDAWWLRVFRGKFGFRRPEAEDAHWIAGVLSSMEHSGVDWTSQFRSLPARLHPSDQSDHPAWVPRWRQRVLEGFPSIEEATRAMNRVNPAVVPRNLILEEALEAISGNGSPALFETLLAAATGPFSEPAGAPELLIGAPDDAPPYRTFCGT